MLHKAHHQSKKHTIIDALEDALDAERKTLHQIIGTKPSKRENKNKTKTVGKTPGGAVFPSPLFINLPAR